MPSQEAITTQEMKVYETLAAENLIVSADLFVVVIDRYPMSKSFRNQKSPPKNFKRYQVMTYSQTCVHCFANRYAALAFSRSAEYRKEVTGYSQHYSSS